MSATRLIARGTSLAALAGPAALVAGLGAPAAAADLTKFDNACSKAQAFLLHEAPPGVDGDAVLAVLCPCLNRGFAAYSQPEIDALTSDLRTGSSYEAKATYPAYLELQGKATGVLAQCFSDPQIVKLIAPGG